MLLIREYQWLLWIGFTALCTIIVCFVLRNEEKIIKKPKKIGYDNYDIGMSKYLISFMILIIIVYGISFGFVNNHSQYRDIKNGKNIYNPIKLIVLYAEREGDATMLSRFIHF